MKGLIWQDDENIIDVVYQTIYGLPVKEALHIVEMYQRKQLIPVEWIITHPKFPRKNEPEQRFIFDIITDWKKRK